MEVFFAVLVNTVAGVPNVLTSASGQRFVALGQPTDTPAQRITGLKTASGAAISSDVIVVTVVLPNVAALFVRKHHYELLS